MQTIRKHGPSSPPWEFIRLSKLIEQIGPCITDCRSEMEVGAITSDPRRVTPGTVFFALPEPNGSVTETIEDAIEKGAIAVVCEKMSGLSPKTPRILVSDVYSALARTAAEFYQNPSVHLKIIGVVGEAGRTSTAWLAKQILTAAGYRTGMIGSIRNEIGERFLPASPGIPLSLDTHHMLAQMRQVGCTACVIEIPDKALAENSLLGVHFDVLIQTDENSDTLGRTLRQISSQTLKSLTLLTPASIKVPAESHTLAATHRTYGLHGGGDYIGAEMKYGIDGTHFRLNSLKNSARCHLPLVGPQNVLNFLAALGAGIAVRPGMDILPAALRQVSPPPGRLENIAPHGPFAIFLDHARKPGELEYVLRTLGSVTEGRLLLTFGCSGNVDASIRFPMGQIAARWAGHTIITSDNPRRESPAIIASHVLRGFCNVRQEGFSIELSRRRAISQIIRMARPGDTILIAGKGHETYQELEDTVVPFDDRFYAREALACLQNSLAEAEYEPVAHLV